MKEINKKERRFKINLKKREDLILVILIAFLVVLFLVFTINKIVTRNHLDVESEIVTELHNYFNSEDLGNCDGLFNYTEGKVAYKDISAETKMCIAYHKTEFKDVKSGSLKATKRKETCVFEGDKLFRTDPDSKECSYKKFGKDEVLNTYKKLYGKDVENEESFRIDNTHICYLKDNEYYCGLSETFTIVLGNESVIYRVIDKAVEKSDTITIYDYFIRVNNGVCYKTYTTSTENGNCSDEYENQKEINYNFMQKYGTRYKHVFKKAKDETYYWVSSEMIKEK